MVRVFIIVTLYYCTASVNVSANGAQFDYLAFLLSNSVSDCLSVSLFVYMKVIAEFIYRIYLLKNQEMYLL